MTEDRLVSSLQQDLDDNERHLRPQVLGDFIGQRQVRENLNVFIQAAKARGDALDHVMFFGPPGLVRRPYRRLLRANLA